MPLAPDPARRGPVTEEIYGLLFPSGVRETEDEEKDEEDDAFLEDRIFSPLGMTSTFFTVPKSEAQRMTSLYSIRDGKADVLVDPGPSSVCLDPPPFLFGKAQHRLTPVLVRLFATQCIG